MKLFDGFTGKWREVKPIDVTKPGDIPPVDLKPITPTPVDVPKPPDPDVSTGFFAELWLLIRKTVKKTASGEGIDLGKLLSLPQNLQKLAILLGILVILVIIPLILTRC